MKAAFVCRACHRRLGAAQAWPVGLRLNHTIARQSPLPVDSHDSQHVSTETSSHHDGFQAPSSRDSPVRDRNPPDGKTTLVPLASESQTMRALMMLDTSNPPRDEAPNNHPGGSGTRNTHKRDDGEKTGSRLNSLGGSMSRRSPAAIKDAKRRKATAESKRKERQLQWEKVRHLCSESELRGVRKAFNFWKHKISRVQLRMEPTTQPWIHDADWICAMKTRQQMQAAWEKLDIEKRRSIWPRLMISTLSTSPQSAPMVLSATLEPLPMGYALADTLYLIAKDFQAKPAATRAAMGEQIFHLLRRLLEDLPPGHMPLNQRTWGIFAKALDEDHAASLYVKLKQCNAVLHPNTMLQFARKLSGSPSNMKHRNMAFSIMMELSHGAIDLNQPQPASVITSLLHCRAPQQTSAEAESFSSTRALQEFMERGFIPNVVTFTAYLDTLTQNREVDEVIRLAKVFTNSGLKLDTKAFATIFRGAKHSSNAGHVREVLELSRGSSVPLTDVLNNALHAIFCYSEVEIRETRTPPSEDLKPFLPMLRIYAKKFDMKPLQSLIPNSLPLLLMQQPETVDSQSTTDKTILPIVDDFVSTTGPEHLQPNLTTLATMLRAYIRSLWRPYDLMALYAYFKARLGEPRTEENYAAQIVRSESSLVHDTFILAMLQQPGLTRPALDVFGDMLKDNLSANASGSKEAGSTATHPMPTIFTYGVLLNGLMRRRETVLAEQVTQIMKENNVDCNLATWNARIKWYAVMQNVPQTVGALQDLEASGFSPNENTFRAFGRLRNQRRALEMMEKIIDLNKQKFGLREPEQDSEQAHGGS